MMTKIYNLDNCKLSNLSYGGNAGLKLGIIFENEYYMLKFPKNTFGLRNIKISYTTSPLSEFIGSQIYRSIGVPVHDTKLGVYNNKLVVICKDIEFEKLEQKARLNVFSNIKNLYHVNAMESYSNSGDVSLKEILIDIKNNHLVKQVGVDKVLEHFWTMFIIDTLLYNNDRNNGNWGLLVNGDVRLAPVFDNGNSFNNKFSDKEMLNRIDKLDELQCKKIASVFKDENGDLIIPYEFFKTQDIPELNKAIKKIVPMIDINKIYSIIDELPNEYNELKVTSDIAKEFMKKGIESRYKLILQPALEREKDKNKRHNYSYDER